MKDFFFACLFVFVVLAMGDLLQIDIRLSGGACVGALTIWVIRDIMESLR